MKLIIAGSRDYTDFETLNVAVMKSLHDVPLINVEIVSGGARGADKLGERFANMWDMKLMKFPADWEKYGRGAGFIRNKQMAEYADALIAFPVGKSSGTRHMIMTAKNMGLQVRYGLSPNLTPFEYRR